MKVLMKKLDKEKAENDNETKTASTNNDTEANKTIFCGPKIYKIIYLECHYHLKLSPLSYLQ